MPSLASLVASFSFLSTLALAASSRGLGPVERQTTSSDSVCPSQQALVDLPGVSFPLTDNFTFTLLSVSRANDSVQSPLALVGSRLTVDDNNNIVARKFNISGGGIFALDSNGNNVGYSNVVLNDSSSLTFYTRGEVYAAPSYCEFVSVGNSTASSPPGIAGPYVYTLAVTALQSGGDSKNFSLCEPTDGGAPAVIYIADEATANGAGYNYKSCFAADIYMLPS